MNSHNASVKHAEESCDKSQSLIAEDRLRDSASETEQLRVIPSHSDIRELRATSEDDNHADDAEEDDDDDDGAGPDGQPVIDIAKPLDRIVDRSVHLLAALPHVFQKSGELVEVVTEQGGRTKPRPMRTTQVRYLLSKQARWMKADDPAHPPAHVANCVLEKTAWNHVRILRAVSPFPAMNSEGRLATQEGYDPQTKTYFAGDVQVEVPAAPTQQEAAEAVATLLDIVQDFPFASDEHRSAWLAGLLSPLARYAHDGNAPIILVQANGPRVGKTSLAQLIAEIVTGTSCPVTTFTKNEDETRKRHLSILRAAPPMELIDNVTGQFGGQNVNALATTRVFEDRVLGSSRQLSVANDTTWYVTGNNIMLAPDTAERCVNVRLHSEEEKPHLRADFKYPHLFETVRERRAELLSAALTILKAFIVAGKPDQKIAAWGGFEAWSRLVRGSLVFAGMPDPANTRYELEENADVETDDKAELVAGLAEWQDATGSASGTKASDILTHLKKHPSTAPTLRGYLEGMAGVAGTLPDPKTFSRHLREVTGRNLRGLVLKREEDAKKGHRWFVEKAA
jgi:hypothetical protein